MVQIAGARQKDALFRPVQYLGSKYRLMDVIGGLVDDLDPLHGRALDLFAGTGVVAAHMSRTRPVAAADIQEYSRVLASALLTGGDPAAPTASDLQQLAGVAQSGSAAALDDLCDYERWCMLRADAGDFEPLCQLVEDGSIVRFAYELKARDPELGMRLEAAREQLELSSATAMTKTYGGVYFSYTQARELDALGATVRALEDPFRDVGIASLLGAASELVSSVGSQFAQPTKPRARSGEPKAQALKAIMRKRSLSASELFVKWFNRYQALEPAPHHFRAIRGDYRDVLASCSADLTVVYADPPYTRDHYSRFYHVLETLAIGDQPEITEGTVAGQGRMSRGLYRRDRHQSPFCIKSQAPAALEELFAGVSARSIPLLLSYSPHGEGSASRPRLMTIPSMTEMAARYFRKIDVFNPGKTSHSKFNAAYLNSGRVFDAELFVICRP